MATSRQHQYDALDARYGIKNKKLSVRGFFRGLRVIECRLQRINEAWCSVEGFKPPSEKWYADLTERIVARFNNQELFRREFYINGDPRGLALKLDFSRSGVPHTEGIERDWGGEDGVLAPNDMV